MLVQFSNSVPRQIRGIFYYNRVTILLTLVLSSAVTAVYLECDVPELALSVVPTSIIGGALAIFLGFRNNSAYDRWWEARKIWGGIVNYSRTWSVMLHSMVGSEAQITKMVKRHLSWLYFLNDQLRKSDEHDYALTFIDDKDEAFIMPKTNRATQLLRLQGEDIQSMVNAGKLDSYQSVKLLEIIEEFYNLQGKAERIKGTVFPYYYSYFTRLFLWLFIVLLPFSLVSELGWACIPVSASISFIFSILEKSGTITEDPFENRAADVPLNAICRTIEIDLLEQLEEPEVPGKAQVEETPFGVKYLK